MKKRILLLYPLCLLLQFWPSPSLAARPKLWHQHSYEEFVAGQTHGVSIDREGTLQLAPTVEPFVELEAERIWSLVADGEGQIYAGTGDGGKLFAIDREGKARLLFDSPETAIHSLMMGADGMLYAGTAPDGLIYRVDPASGQATTLAHTGSHYVWELIAGERGRLYAATGEPGRVLAISGDGGVETLYDPADRHVICLVRRGEKFYAGTAGKARIYEVADGRGRLLYAAPQQEIHDLVPGPEGVLYASALPEPGEKEKDKVPAAIYRIAVDGTVTPLWQEADVALVDLVADAGGDLIAAALEPSRLYRVEGERRTSLLVDFAEARPSRLLMLPGGELYVGGAQAGSILRLGTGERRQGEFESAVEDFAAHSRWGTTTWRVELPEGTRLRLQTRSGNSEEPDDTWSEWSAELEKSGSRIASPPARYLQYRISMESDRKERTPRLHEVRLHGQQVNLRPEIGQLEVAPYRTRQRGDNGAQDAAAKAAAASSNGRQRPPTAKSLYLVRWQASDPNGDELAYRIFLRSVDQQEWKLVEEEIAQTSVMWDTETMPEGMTLLKLVASDHPDNPDGQALEEEQVSIPFPIDNSPPKVSLKARREGALVRVDCEIEDRISPVYKGQYRIDYEDRVHQIIPQDGLFDSRMERCGFSVEGLAPGEHVIAVQAWDELDNIGTAQVIVQIR